jgi:glycosyltransferase involved in cell wall biosynthesis
LPEYTVVVPAYRAAEEIGRCVWALGAQTVPRERYEIVVVDDGSGDETAAVAREAGADRVLVCSHRGPAAARNAGVEVSRGEIILFTDADCEPVPDWIERMVGVFCSPDVMGAKGVYQTQQGSLVARFVQLEYEDKYDKMRGQSHIDFVDTYSAAYRRRVFELGSYFDPAFPLAANEDVEFSYRLARLGHRLVFAPQAVVSHRHADTVGGYFRRKYFVGFWRVRMYRLHPGKAISDSHTPQVLKLQVGLMAVLLGSLVLAVFRPGLLVVSGVSVALFLMSGIPFIVKALRRDPAVAFAAPGLLLLRALALGVGFAVGILCQFLPQRSVESAALSSREAGDVPPC